MVLCIYKRKEYYDMNLCNTWTLRKLDSDFVERMRASNRRKRNNRRTVTTGQLARTLGVTSETVVNRYKQHLLPGKTRHREIPIDIAAKIVTDDLERKLLKASKVKANVKAKSPI
jgi:hypothetical protein